MLRLRTLGGLSIERSNGEPGPNVTPRRLAVLAVAAAAGRRGVSRTRLRALFWPDADDARARHALSQTLYALRRELGHDAIGTDADLRLDPDLVSTDLDQFREAINRRDWAAASRLYEGPFAEGFVLEDTPQLERWLEETRATVAREAERACQSLAQEAAASGNPRLAAQAWERLTTLDPLSARYANSYMEALVAVGDRARALAHAKVHAASVRRELESDPDPAVVALADRLRSEIASTPAAPLAAALQPAQVAAGNGPASVPPGRAPTAELRRYRPFALVVALVAAAAVLVAASVVRSRESPARPVLAVGAIRDLTSPDSSQLGGVLSEVVATSLARLTGVEVIANSRILELLPSGGDTIRSARTDAARRAGATEILEGELVPRGAGQVRFELRRIEIGRGSVLGGYSVTGTDRFALIDSITSLVAADLEIGGPVRSLADLVPRSPIAIRLYEEGLRSYYRLEMAAADRLFRAAMAEDSTFALPALYVYRIARRAGAPTADLEARALRLAAMAPDRERLLLEAAIRTARNDPAALPYADSLVARYPRDPEALLRAAEALTTRSMIGSRERDLLERAIAIDSAAGLSPDAPCRLCDALEHLAMTHRAADSGAAAERVLLRYVRLRPLDPAPIRNLALHQFALGRYEVGLSTMARLSLLPQDGDSKRDEALILVGQLLAGRLDEADADCMGRLAQHDQRARLEYLRLCAMVWRSQGRYRDASALVLAARLPDGTGVGFEPARDPIIEAVLERETGRPMLALKALDALGSEQGIIGLVLRGAAALDAGEIQLAQTLADSAENAGRETLSGIDRSLHYFIRGLTAGASGDRLTAADFFRRSIVSPTFGLTRANAELARTLLSLGRPAEAIPPLRAALAGGWDGLNLHQSRTELHELLAQAFAATSRRDSATTHYAVVERSWRRADPVFAERYQVARDWLRQW